MAHVNYQSNLGPSNLLLSHQVKLCLLAFRIADMEANVVYVCQEKKTFLSKILVTALSC